MKSLFEGVRRYSILHKAYLLIWFAFAQVFIFGNRTISRKFTERCPE